MLNSTKKSTLHEFKEMSPINPFQNYLQKLEHNFKEDQEFKIKITKALENLWRDEQNRRNQLLIQESMKFYISYKNNLETNSNDPDFLPHVMFLTSS